MFISFKHILFLIISISSTHATTFMNRPLNDVIKEAPIIVRGTARLDSTSWDKNHRQVYTYTEFNVIEVLKGDLNESKIRLRQPGGAVDGVEVAVPGVARFSSGEEAVVLLAPKNQEDDSYDVPGFTTGKYNVVTKDSGEILLVNSLGGGAVYDPGQNSHALSYNSTIPLDEFRKLASGEKTATVKQYEATNRPPITEAPHSKSGQTQVATTQGGVESVLPQDNIQTESRSRFIMPASLMAIVLLIALGFWGLYKRR